MERQTLLFTPKGSAAVTPYANVNAPAGAFGDAQGAVADLGRGLMSAGGSVAQIGAVQAERERRKAQDTRQSAVVASDEAKDKAQTQLSAYLEKLDTDPDSVNEDEIIPELTKTYNTQLQEGLKSRKIDPKYTETDEFKYHVRNPIDDVVRAATRVVNEAKGGRRVRAQTTENLSAFQHFDQTGDFARIQVAITNTRNLTGVTAEAKNQLIRDAMESAEIRIPKLLSGKSKEERAAFASLLVDQGPWTAERAASVTKPPQLDEASKTLLKNNVLNAADKGDKTAMVEALTRLSDSVSPEDLQVVHSAALARQTLFNVSTQVHSPEPDSPFGRVQNLRSELKSLQEDPTGSSVFKKFLRPEDAARVGEADLRSLQDRYKASIERRITEFTNNPGVALEKFPFVSRASKAVSDTFSGVIAGRVDPNDPEVIESFDRYNDTLRQAASISGVQLPASVAVPESVAHTVLAGIADPQMRKNAGAFYLQLASMPGTGRAISDGIRAQAWNSQDPVVRGAAPYLHIASVTAAAGGPASADSAKRFLELGLDRERIARAQAAKLTLEVPSKNKTISPETFTLGVLRTAAPGTEFEASLKTITSGILTSNDSTQTLARYADGLASQEASRGLSGQAGSKEYMEAFTNVILSASASAGGATSPETVFTHARDMVNSLFASGLTVVREDGIDVLTHNDLKSTQVASIFSPASADILTSVEVGTRAAQAVVDHDRVIADRYALARAQKGKSSGNGFFNYLLSNTAGAGVEAYRSWNWTFFGADIGQVDIDSRFMPKEIAKDLGIDRVSELAPVYDMDEADFATRTVWRSNPDGSRTLHIKPESIRFFGGRASAPVDRNYAVVTDANGAAVVQSAEQVSAARAYFKLQGTYGGEASIPAKIAPELRKAHDEEVARINKTYANDDAKRRLELSLLTSRDMRRDFDLDVKRALARQLLDLYSSGK